jgi:DNA-binding transcriptional ArsR family regulator
MGDFCSEIEKLGKGIRNAHRYRILECLMKGPRPVSGIVKAVKLSQPAVSQHLKTLKALGLVEDEKRGQRVYYSLNGAYMLKMLNGFMANIKKGRSNGTIK